MQRELLHPGPKGCVSGWVAPRLPPLRVARRRGYKPDASRLFCSRIGYSKTNGIIDFLVLEQSVREDLNKRAARLMAVLDPVKVVIENYAPSAYLRQLLAI